jgi:hypothetical protein
MPRTFLALTSYFIDISRWRWRLVHQSHAWWKTAAQYWNNASVFNIGWVNLLPVFTAILEIRHTMTSSNIASAHSSKASQKSTQQFWNGMSIFEIARVSSTSGFWTSSWVSHIKWRSPRSKLTVDYCYFVEKQETSLYFRNWFQYVQVHCNLFVSQSSQRSRALPVT